MYAGTSLDIDAELERLTDILAADMADGVPRSEIESSIRQAREDFGDPPITQFLPVLIERRVRSRFRR